MGSQVKAWIDKSQGATAKEVFPEGVKGSDRHAMSEYQVGGECAEAYASMDFLVP